VLLWQSWGGQAWFWDDLDYIGVPYYYNGPRDDSEASVSDIVTQIKRVQSTNLARAMNNFSEPVIATEMGRPNFDGTSHDPWNWSDAQDNQEVVDYAEAAFVTMVELGPRFEGVFIWKLWPRSDVYPIDWDFRRKPLARAIALWYTD
jgi:hypothetical protein